MDSTDTIANHCRKYSFFFTEERGFVGVSDSAPCVPFERFHYYIDHRHDSIPLPLIR